MPFVNLTLSCLPFIFIYFSNFGTHANILNTIPMYNFEISHYNDSFPFWIWSWVSNSKKSSKDNLLPNGMAWSEDQSGQLTDFFLMNFLSHEQELIELIR